MNTVSCILTNITLCAERYRAFGGSRLPFYQNEKMNTNDYLFLFFFHKFAF